MVRGAVPAPHRAGRAVRAAVHHRGAVRAPGRQDHRQARSTSPASRCRCSCTSALMWSVRVLARRCASGSPTRAPRRVAFTAAGNNFELAHRRRDRRLRRHLRPGARRRRRPPHRGPRPRRPRLRRRWARRRYYPGRSSRHHELLRLRHPGSPRPAPRSGSATTAAPPCANTTPSPASITSPAPCPMLREVPIDPPARTPALHHLRRRVHRRPQRTASTTTPAPPTRAAPEPETDTDHPRQPHRRPAQAAVPDSPWRPPMNARPRRHPA